nr:MBOAT family protein [Lachnospiraceae bacterium]
MVFSSMFFLWVFLPVTFILSRLIRPIRYQNILLLMVSLIFYAWGEPVYVVLLLVSVFINWLSGMLMYRFPSAKRSWLVLAVVADLSLLGYYKYANFAINSINKLTGASFPMLDLALPIGISFFTFQALSYVIDLYRGKYEVQKNILSLALYISFFPQLIAGPIVKYKDVNDQIDNREITREKTAEGIRRFIYGLGKKVLIANILAKSADDLFGLTAVNMNMGMAWFAAISYTLQIYYDFSGYSDMA